MMLFQLFYNPHQKLAFMKKSLKSQNLLKALGSLMTGQKMKWLILMTEVHKKYSYTPRSDNIIGNMMHTCSDKSIMSPLLLDNYYFF
mmetsp:Transcript_22583/g.29571  ORF Transcript_22583/g.29571 Transcript_22583/m.29571 type:complete len:87 (+) Transcript_22583:511-771(+)